MISQHSKTEITIYKSEKAGELIKMAAVKGHDVTRDGDDWKVGNDVGRIRYIKTKSGYYYEMITINELFVEVELSGMIEEIEMSELAQLSLGYVKNLPIDARKWSKETLQRAYIIGMIEKGDTRKWKFADYFDFSHMMDAHVLWELCQDMIKSHTGASIQKHHDWAKINIAYKGLPYFSERDLSDMERILLKLDNYRYIYFRSAGSVWSIREREAA